MGRPMIERLFVENYGCIKKETFALTPLHAFIGPNDSGKSTILRAAYTLAYAYGMAAFRVPLPPDVLPALMANASRAETKLSAETQQAFFELNVARGNDIFQRFGALTPTGRAPAESHQVAFGTSAARITPADVTPLAGAQLLRLDPDNLRAPSGDLTDDDPIRLRDEHGTGLASVYQALVNRDEQRFSEVKRSVQALFPYVKAIKVKTPSPGLRALAVDLVTGEEVAARLMSEGLLYYLAYAILPCVEPTALLLVEEPENGLHPARISDVMRVLREMSKTTQVLIATHSPLVINEMKPEEVTVVRRRGEEGTKGTLMKDTKNFDDRSKVYALGELWLSYANGEDEAPLIEGGPVP